MFQLRRRTADMAPAKRKKKRHGEDMTDPRAPPPQHMLPMLVEINPGMLKSADTCFILSSSQQLVALA